MSTDIAAEITRFRTERSSPDSFPQSGALLHHVAERDGLDVEDVHRDTLAAIEAGTVGVHTLGRALFLHLPGER